MIVKLLTEHHLEFLSLKGGCRGSSESTHVKIPHCWKSNARAHFLMTSKVILAIQKFVLISDKHCFKQNIICRKSKKSWHLKSKSLIT